MKKCIKLFIIMLITVSFMLTGCAMNKSAENQPGSDDSHLYTVEGRVTEIVGKNTVLIQVLRGNRDFQKGDTVAVKYYVSQESSLGLNNLENFEAKPMEVKIGDFVSVAYGRAEKRDIGEIKDCNYIRPTGGYLDIILKERYESMHSEDADTE